MGIPSSMSDFIYKSEGEIFPSPSEKEKLNKAIERTQFIINKFGQRPDIIEEKFHLADLLVGRGQKIDYAQSSQYYEEILSLRPNPYLKARCLIGKAELAIPEIKKEQIPHAIDLCQSSQEILKKLPKEDKLIPNYSFFKDKAYIIEAELRVTRDETDEKGEHLDHELAMKIYESIIENRKSNWYFRARANLGKAELISFHYPNRTSEGILLCERALNLLRGRLQDYFTQKTRIVEAELRINRGRETDLKAAQQLLNELAKKAYVFPDLIARTKLDLAQISKHPKAKKLFREVVEMEGLDPYILKMSKQVEKKIEKPQE